MRSGSKDQPRLAFRLSDALAPASSLGLLAFFINSPAMESVSLTFAPCSQVEVRISDPPVACEAAGFSPDELMVAGPDRFGFDLQFGSLLSGCFDVVDTHDEAHFFGVDENPIISIGIGVGDNIQHPCNTDPGFPDRCPTRGVWLLDRSTIPVPEPSTLCGLLVGLIAVVTARRRRATNP